MGLKTFTIDFSELAIDPKIGLKDYSPLYKTGIRLKDFLLNKNVTTDIKSGRTPSRFNENYWNGDYEFLTMSDVNTLTFSLNKECSDKITDFAIEEEKTLYQAKENSLIVSNAMTLGLSFIIDRAIYINQNVFEVNLDETKINKKFVLWYFNLIIRPLFQTIYTSKYLSKDELGRIKIPLIPKTTQDQIVARIEPIESKIKELKTKIRPAQEAINKVFARKFGFDLEKFEELKNEKFFEEEFSSIANYDSLRIGVKNYRKNYEYLFDFLKSIEMTKLSKTFGYIRNSIAPELDNNGEIKVVKIKQLRNGYIDYENCETVLNDFYEKNKERLGIRKDDIFVVNRGIGSIGKVDLCEDVLDEDYLIGGSIYILRELKEDFNHQFITYFFRSVLGYSQMEFGFFGNTNQIALYLPILNNIQIPNIPLKAQQKIVDEIKAELDEQEETKKRIEAERNKIDKIIEKTIT